MRIKSRPCCDHNWASSPSNFFHSLYVDILSAEGCEVMIYADGKIWTVKEYNGERALVSTSLKNLKNSHTLFIMKEPV